MKRNSLLQKGLFPETLPPCFDSEDLPRALRGLCSQLSSRQFWKSRATTYVRYSGTKHDGNRRAYSTPNPISYFSVSSFVDKNWKAFEKIFSLSDFSISAPRPGKPTEDRAIVIAPLSELADKLSKKIRYAPFILKTDISQFFPSIYTHIMPWVVSGVDVAKADRKPNSKAVKFNALDWACQQCQNEQTRGILIGPDAFRLIAELVACKIDHELSQRAGKSIVGAVRHVDDFYIGVRTEFDATIVLSHLRDILQNYELQINDAKTKIISGLDPVDDVWAQNLREMSGQYVFTSEKMSHALDVAYETSRQVGSESPMKLIVRRLDLANCYAGASWEAIEPKLQRICYHFPHCVDYICLLVAKRVAMGGAIDAPGWGEVACMLVKKCISLNHHHEMVWLLWLVFVCNISVPRELIDEVSKVQNSHIRALLIAGSVDGVCQNKPSIKLGSQLNTTKGDWLENVVARATGYSKAKFSGGLSPEFEHLASKKLVLINFKSHMKMVADKKVSAISASKYGYDAPHVLHGFQDFDDIDGWEPPDIDDIEL